MKEVVGFEDYRGYFHKTRENAENAELGYFIDELADIMYNFEDGDAITALCEIMVKVNSKGLATKAKMQKFVDALDIRA